MNTSETDGTKPPGGYRECSKKCGQWTGTSGPCWACIVSDDPSPTSLSGQANSRYPDWSPPAPVAKDAREGCKAWCGLPIDEVPNHDGPYEVLEDWHDDVERAWCTKVCRDNRYPTLSRPAPPKVEHPAPTAEAAKAVTVQAKTASCCRIGGELAKESRPCPFHIVAVAQSPLMLLNDWDLLPDARPTLASDWVWDCLPDGGR